ncbi:MAG: aldo/keto reductase [Planctomycetota bacterium]|nr:aldo/keto reductase [Planctomycetota bacterium]
MSNVDPERGLDRRRFIQGVSAGVAGLAVTGAASELLADEKKAAGATVKRRPLGGTGIDASVVIYGCGSTRPDHLPMLQTAYDRGVNTFDVAWGYQRGQAEVAVGQFLKTLDDRSKVHVITKATGFNPRGSAQQVYTSLKRRMQESLKRLQTDYVDVFYCPHGATNPSQFANKALEDALLKLKEEKLVKHVGASSHTNYRRVGEAAVQKSWCEVFMPVANICTQNVKAATAGRGRRGGRPPEDTRPMLATAKKRNIGLVAMKVAKGGYLTNQTDALLAKEFPAKSKLSRHQKLYTYMLGQPGVSAVVVGIGTVKHLREMLVVGAAVKA